MQFLFLIKTSQIKAEGEGPHATRPIVMTTITLRTVVFLGSARNIVPPVRAVIVVPISHCFRPSSISRVSSRTMCRPPTAQWGGDSRLGDRVLAWVQSALASRTASVGTDTVTHQLRIVDPLEVFGPGGALAHSGGELKAPAFFTAPDQLPAAAKQLQDDIKDADCYLIVSPEYNHSIPPALASVMGHFGGSNYKCKPSGIVCYSPGPFAGMRAAMAIQV